MKIKCEGWRRHGGVFTLGPVTWEQCKNTPTVMLKIEQEKKVRELPACPKCWKEVIDNKIKVISSKPIL